MIVIKVTNMSDPKWLDVNKFDDLCDKGAQYINGEIDDFIIWRGPLMEESIDIKDYLNKINKRGFFTLISQPSHKDEPILFDPKKANFNHNYKRAFVTGFMEKSKAEKFYQLLIHDLDIDIYLSNKDDTIENEIATIVDYKTRLGNAKNIFDNYCGNGYGVNCNSIYNMTDDDFRKTLQDLVLYGFLTYSSGPCGFKHYNGISSKYLSQKIISLFNDTLVGVTVIDKIYNRQEDYLWNVLINSLNEC